MKDTIVISEETLKELASFFMKTAISRNIEEKNSKKREGI